MPRVVSIYLPERGINASYESMRRWGKKFGAAYPWRAVVSSALSDRASDVSSPITVDLDIEFSTARP